MITPQQYGQLATLLAEGKLQCVSADGTVWHDVKELFSYATMRDMDMGKFRERPQPTMPDEVWLPDGQVSSRSCVGTVRSAYDMREAVAKVWEGSNAVRYIRADGVIDGARLQWRPKSKELDQDWRNPNNCEYRFKE